jgi:N-methylhydantoinase B/oxoprolinase/acetone carboxylase alpha subunit
MGWLYDGPVCFREKEIEQKISRLEVKEGEKGEERGGGGAYRPPGARDREPIARDDRQRYRSFTPTL